MIATALGTLGILLLIAAALQDIVARTVSNGLVIGLAVVAASLRELDGSLLTGVLVASVVFAGALAIWRFGWMGGGDVKLLGAAVLLLPPSSAPSLIVGMSLSGGVLALLFIATRRRIPAPRRPRPTGLFARAIRAEQWRLRRGGPLPYAVAIASGAMIVIVQDGFLR